MIRIVNLADVDSDKLFVRNPDDSGVQDVVAGIIREVRADGDDALLRYAARFDGAAPDALEVSDAEIEAAFAIADQKMVAVLKKRRKSLETACEGDSATRLHRSS